MLITIQFPISDSRAFIADSYIANSYEHGIPCWLAFRDDRDYFVRSFGAIRRRPLGGLSGWLGESYICEANHAIRFQAIEYFKFSIKNLTKPIKFKVIFRRFYFDGLSVGKFEVGFAVWGFTQDYFWNPWLKIKLSAEDTKEFLLHFFQLPILVPNPYGNPTTCQLWQAGEPLAKLYAVSSTSKEVFSKGQYHLEDWWVQSGEPTILITYQEYNERLQFPFLKKVLDLKEADNKHYRWCRDAGEISHYFIRHEGRSLRMWLIGEYNPNPSDELRQLRIFLLRLHAERACLKQVIPNLVTKKLLFLKDSEQFTLFKTYINNVTERIKKLEKHSDTRAEAKVAELAREAVDYFTPGECDMLLESLKKLGFDKDTLQKVEKLVQPTHIHLYYGDFYKMTNTYDIDNQGHGQIGSIGEHNQIAQINFNKIGSEIEKSVDLQKLADELGSLRQAMTNESTEAEHSIAIGEVAKAEQAAKTKNATKVAEYLKSAGKWSLEIASKIGVLIAVEAIKRAMGIPL